MSTIKFGTDGWRAVIARDFTFANCRLVAQGIAGYVNSANLAKKGIIIGYDNRFMSPDFARECARVLLGNGIKVYLMSRPVPTPVTAFAIQVKETGGAIMITASHNPPEYNGIKFIPEYAGPALPDVTDAVEKEIQRVIDSGKVYELALDEAAQFDLFEEIDVDEEYQAQLLKMTQVDAFKNNPIRVVVDPMFGAGIGYLDKVLSRLGCEVFPINNHRDPLFGGSLPEPTDANLADLKRAVTSYKADIGLALDGDADRFGIIDNEGHFINANRFMALLLEHLLNSRQFRGPVARSIATTHMLDRIARKNGLSAMETPVGFKYIGQCLRDKGCMLGGEESGGLSILGHVPEKDGILACLLAAEMVAYHGKTLAGLENELSEKYGTMYSHRLDVKVNPADKSVVLNKLEEYRPKSIAGIAVESISSLEGLKIVLEEGSWVLVRPSGTEPLFRIYVETGQEEQLPALQKEVLQALGLNG
jgi:alpha-D-glucose phosphate-specific phosphoglucomutase